jgi:hypothetical protein
MRDGTSAKATGALIGAWMALATAPAAQPAKVADGANPPPASRPSAPPNALTDEEKAAGFVLLFDGKGLDGWTPQGKDFFRVADGKIIADGTKGRSMLFYSGDVAQHHFTDFEFRCQVYCHGGSNSGIYFHTKAVEKGFPDAFGYEAQIANTHKNAQKTGSLYKVRQVNPSPVKDNEWFDYGVIVRGRRIVIRTNGKEVVDYTEPDNKRRLMGGTIGIQCHDPAVVEFRSIRLRVLAPEKGK